MLPRTAMSDCALGFRNGVDRTHPAELNVIDTTREAISDSVITTGNVYRNWPIEPVSIKKGR